jgi:hypothetical protein
MKKHQQYRITAFSFFFTFSAKTHCLFDQTSFHRISAWDAGDLQEFLSFVHLGSNVLEAVVRGAQGVNR